MDIHGQVGLCTFQNLLRKDSCVPPKNDAVEIPQHLGGELVACYFSLVAPFLTVHYKNPISKKILQYLLKICSLQQQ